jgi:Na+/H+-dicarboxylate symporter
MADRDAGVAANREAKPRFPLHLQIVTGIVIGLLLGPILGRDANRLGDIGKLVIQLIKAAAAPLLFLSIVQAILKTEVQARAALRLFFWATVNASIALGFGLLLSNLIQPGRSLAGFVPAKP